MMGQYRQRYRSGHNGADSKSVWEQSHEGSNPSRCATSPRTSYRSRRLFIKITSHSFCRGSFPNRNYCVGLRFGFWARTWKPVLLNRAGISRRSKLHIACSDFFQKSEQASYCLLRLFSKVRARSLRCASFPNRTRPGVCWPYGERMYPTRKRQNHVSGGTRQGKSSHLCAAVIRMCVGAALSCSGGRPQPSGGYFSAFLGPGRAGSFNGDSPQKFFTASQPLVAEISSSSWWTATAFSDRLVTQERRLIS